MQDKLAVALIGYKDVVRNDFYQRNPQSLDKYQVEFNEGKKYVKVVMVHWDSRSVHSFVEKATGLIWRAKSWKAPALNHPRGNIFDQSSYLNRISWTGII
jgi:hypothetical protein